MMRERIAWHALFARSSLPVPSDDRYPSLLDLAEACDVPVGFGRRNGTCHSSESSLLAGEVSYYTEPLEPPPDGRVLVCTTRLSSETDARSLTAAGNVHSDRSGRGR